MFLGRKSKRFHIDYVVDRSGMEALRSVNWTDTNRSCDLIIHMQISESQRSLKNLLVIIKQWSDPIPFRTRPSNTVLPMVVAV